MSPETVQELGRRLDHFIVDFTSNITNSGKEAGLPKNVYAPKYRTQKKVGFQLKLYPIQHLYRVLKQLVPNLPLK